MMSSQGPGAAGAAGSSLAREQAGAERSSHRSPGAAQEWRWRRLPGVPVLVSVAGAHSLAHSSSTIMNYGSAQVPGA